MSTRGRKARKRAGIKFTKAQKTSTGPRLKEHRGLGLVSGAELHAALVTRGAL